MSRPSAKTLGPLLHVCRGCGGSCQGVSVSVSDDELPAVRRHARELGVGEPFEDGRLKQIHGHCVFLDDDSRCALHTRFGFEAKPAICRQYPLVLVETGDGLRSGIDPGCYTAWQTWRSGPEAPLHPLVAARVALDDTQQRQERAVLGLTRGANTTAGLAAALCAAEIDATGLPTGFAARALHRLHHADLGAHLELSGGPTWLAAMRPVFWRLTQLDAPPPWSPLSADQEAWAIESLRRLIFLRLVHRVPVVQAVTAAGLLGVLACGWTSPDRFGPALAGWMRLVRMGWFWERTLPDLDALRDLFAAR